MGDENIGRRDFLKTAAAGVLVLWTEEELAKASPIRQTKPSGPPVKIGVIGLGLWGREILATLSRQDSGVVTAICDTYEPYLNKGREIAPRSALVSDYRRVLDSPDVEAIVLATPSHLHRDIALHALQAGKHVYCEAPLATTVDDAKAIAIAGRGMSKLIFQAGLQGRSNALYRHVSQFVRSGALGTPVSVAAQWNKKQSWRRPAPTPSRENEMNWRLSSKTSAGLLGEVGIHQLDLINWYLKALPTAVTGFSSIAGWNDGRDVPDTVTCVFDYPGGVRALSLPPQLFSDSYTLFQGTNSSLMMREKRGWMVKEADSPLLGWEVYARKESINNETGICMVADATKLLEAGKEPGKEGPLEPVHDALYRALEDFTRSFARVLGQHGQPRVTRRRSSRSRPTRRLGRRRRSSINQPCSNSVRRISNHEKRL
jgi:predicted dehydrogenase